MEVQEIRNIRMLRFWGKLDVSKGGEFISKGTYYLLENGPTDLMRIIIITF